jgi:hypothetical protein
MTAIKTLIFLCSFIVAAFSLSQPGYSKIRLQ